MTSTPRRLVAIVSAIGALAVAGPVTGAFAAGTTPPPAFTFPTYHVPTFTFPSFTFPTFTMPTLPAGGLPTITLAPGLTFVPPYVGPIEVHIGAIIIDGQQISPGVNVTTPGTAVPPSPATTGP
ncbi:MAG TPA: hypothetical protein VGO39_00275 [Gaiellaceae bacterium]|jgi:hypothetical protein|nr:hypothetical protein [Gaiellaceae bacterium]